MKNLSHRELNQPVCEINLIVDYLDITLNHAAKLLSTFMSFDSDENGNAITDTSLNFEALDELAFAVKKISSKADVLQNKVSELKKVICK
jgi:hypothetical protein